MRRAPCRQARRLPRRFRSRHFSSGWLNLSDSLDQAGDERVSARPTDTSNAATRAEKASLLNRLTERCFTGGTSEKPSAGCIGKFAAYGFASAGEPCLPAALKSSEARVRGPWKKGVAVECDCYRLRLWNERTDNVTTGALYGAYHRRVRKRRRLDPRRANHKSRVFSAARVNVTLHLYSGVLSPPGIRQAPRPISPRLARRPEHLPTAAGTSRRQTL